MEQESHKTHLAGWVTLDLYKGQKITKEKKERL